MRTPRVLLVSKSECPLCDAAKHALEVVGAEILFALEVRRIEDDEALRAAHALEVPVVFVDGKKRFFGQVSPLLLRRELRVAAGAPPSWVKLSIAVGVLLVVGLAVALAIVPLQRRRERQRVDTTKKLLEAHAELLVRGNDPKGIHWLIDMRSRSGAPIAFCLVKRTELSGDERVIRDAWGNPIIYCQPGPVHPNGFDLYSVGPNGIDEHGGGDDIVVGGDVAPVAS